MDSFIVESVCSKTGKPVYIQYYKGADDVWTRWEALPQRPATKGGGGSGEMDVGVSINLSGCRVRGKYACPHCGSRSENECGAQIKIVGGKVARGCNLSQGETIILSAANSTIKKFVVGLGWDPARDLEDEDIDCDSAAALYENGRLWDFVYFGTDKTRGKIVGKNGAVTHSPDDLTGNFTRGNVDETMEIILDKVPATVDKIVFLVNIYDCDDRGQTFGKIENAFIRISDDKGKKLCEYILKGNYSSYTAIYVGEAYRSNGGWAFRARGEGSRATSLGEMR